MTRPILDLEAARKSASEAETRTFPTAGGMLYYLEAQAQRAVAAEREKYESRVAALEGALKDLIARVDAVGNWGPLSPVTDTHRTLLDGGTR